MQRLGRVFSFVIVAAAAAILSGCVLQTTPRAEFSATPQFGYPPLEVTFDAAASTSSNGLIIDYAWNLGDGETAGGVTVTHTYAEKGVYAITLEVRDSAGRTGERTRDIEALNRPPMARFSTNVATTGVHQPVWFDASESSDPDGEIAQYLWSFGDGETAEGVIIEHEFPARGTGWRPEITLTVIDDEGAEDSVTRQILVVGCENCGG
jgi:PKD repeat protein